MITEGDASLTMVMSRSKPNTGVSGFSTSNRSYQPTPPAELMTGLHHYSQSVGFIIILIFYLFHSVKLTF